MYVLYPCIQLACDKFINKWFFICECCNVMCKESERFKSLYTIKSKLKPFTVICVNCAREILKRDVSILL